jgi:hypothetical protein
MLNRDRRGTPAPSPAPSPIFPPALPPPQTSSYLPARFGAMKPSDVRVTAAMSRSAACSQVIQRCRHGHSCTLEVDRTVMRLFDAGSNKKSECSTSHVPESTTATERGFRQTTAEPAAPPAATLDSSFCCCYLRSSRTTSWSLGDTCLAFLKILVSERSLSTLDVMAEMLSQQAPRKGSGARHPWTVRPTCYLLFAIFQSFVERSLVFVIEFREGAGIGSKNVGKADTLRDRIVRRRSGFEVEEDLQRYLSRDPASIASLPHHPLQANRQEALVDMVQGTHKIHCRPCDQYSFLRGSGTIPQNDPHPFPFHLRSTRARGMSDPSSSWLEILCPLL